MKKRIVYLRSTSIINDSRATKEINTFLKNGYDVIALGWDRQGLVRKNQKFKSYFFKYSAPYGGSLRTIWGLLKFQIWLYKMLIVLKNDFDYIHACDFDTGYVAMKYSKKYKRKYVYDMYDYYIESRTFPKLIENIIRNLDNYVIKNSHSLIICAEWRYEQIPSRFKSKTYVIHNTPEIIQFKDSFDIDKNSKIKICYVGILQENRLLIEILDNIVNEKNIEFHIAGFGILEEKIKEYCKKYENIKFYGSLQYDDVLSLEKKCDLLFATYNPLIRNHKFSAPNKVYEAMYLQKPIIVCKNTGVDKLVVLNGIGDAIDYDGRQFIKSVNRIFSNESKLKLIKNKQKKIYEKMYNWNIMEKRLMRIYKEIER